MPEITKLKRSDTTEKKAPAKKVGGRKKKVLSLVKSQPSNNFGTYIKVIYGDIGVGKTTLALQQENSYALMFEPNKSYACYQDTINCWQDMIDLVEQLIEGKHKYTNIIVDGLRTAYEMSLEYACKTYDFQHPGDMNDYGASWNKVNQAFISPIRQVLNSKYGLTFVCHAKEKTIITKSGQKFIEMMPNLGKAATDCIINPFENVFYYHVDTGRRFLQIVGDEYVTAKNRMEGHFLTVSGERIFKIPMGNNPKQAYKNLLNAYNNKQIEAYKPAPLVKKGGLKKLAVKKKHCNNS